MDNLKVVNFSAEQQGLSRLTARRHTIYENLEKMEVLPIRKSGSDNSLNARDGFVFLSKSQSAPILCEKHGALRWKCDKHC